MDKTKKFYVGSNNVWSNNSDDCRPWAKKTETEAIEHAKRILEKNPHQEYAFVVKVVAVVKRDRPPFKVERVK